MGKLKQQIKRIQKDNDTEFAKLIALLEHMQSEKVQDSLGTGEYSFTLGFAGHTIEFYDLAQVYNDFMVLLENAINEY